MQNLKLWFSHGDYVSEDGRDQFAVFAMYQLSSGDDVRTSTIPLETQTVIIFFDN